METNGNPRGEARRGGRNHKCTDAAAGEISAGGGKGVVGAATVWIGATIVISDIASAASEISSPASGAAGVAPTAPTDGGEARAGTLAPCDMTRGATGKDVALIGRENCRRKPRADGPPTAPTEGDGGGSGAGQETAAAAASVVVVEAAPGRRRGCRGSHGEPNAEKCCANAEKSQENLSPPVVAIWSGAASTLVGVTTMLCGVRCLL